MSQADLLAQDPVFQLKGSMLAITVMELAHNDLERLDAQLTEKVAQAPAFFSNTPLVLALDKLPEGEGELDLAQLMALCRRHGLRTLAIRASRESDVAAAEAMDLPVLPPSGARERLLDPAQKKIEEKPVEPEHKPSRIITSPVRGGQQIYAQGGDLIVLAPVSAGAELLADGNIHVYAPMRGRAHAWPRPGGHQGQHQGTDFLSANGRRNVVDRRPLQGCRRPAPRPAVGRCSARQPVG